MFRVQSLIFASLLLVSASAFAAETPDPNSTGDAAVPSGSNAGNPPSTQPAGDTVTDKEKSGNATATSPGEENKGKPPIKTE